MSRLLAIAVLALLACPAARAHIAASPVSAPEFHAAGAVAALTLLLGGVAVLKGWRRE